jgi:hypothetical protein
MKGARMPGREKNGLALRRPLGPLLGLLAVAAVGAMSAQGCTTGPIVYSDCPIDDDGKLTVPLECCPCPTPEGCEILYYSKGKTPPPVPDWCCEKGYDVPACWDEGASAMPRCPGECVPQAPEGWDGPEFVYIGSGFGSGPDLSTPDCPIEAPNRTFEGWPEPVIEPPTCPTCACDEPLGTCKLPETWTVRSEPCLGGGGVETPFDPPAGWDGACSANDAIPAGQLCGGKPCVRSLTVSAPVIEEQPCKVLTKEEGDSREPPKLVPFAPPPTSTMARACASLNPWAACHEEPGKLCPPTSGPEFSTCVRKTGDEACPEGWPERHLVYNDVDVDSSCSPCECSAPTGGSCVVTFNAYATATCDGLSAGTAISAADMPQCVDVTSGLGLGSKAAEVFAYEKGTCMPSGGQPIIDVKLDGGMTICCLPGA